MSLKIAKGLSLPLDVVTQTVAIESVDDSSLWAWMPAVVAFLAAVVGLLFRCSPSAVLWRIRSVVVWESINRMGVRWPMSHIGKECLETVFPSVTYGDPTSAIFRIIRIVSVEAACLYALPGCIFNRLSQSMRAVRFSNSFQAKAPTGRALFSKVVLPDDDGCTAVTTTGPSAMTRGWYRSFIENNKFSKSLSTQVRNTFHVCIIQEKIINGECL